MTRPLTKWPVPALASGEGAHEPRGVTVDLHLGDCLEYMRTMPNKSVDCVVTDPPYGIDIARKSNNFGVATEHSRQGTQETWDASVPDSRYFAEIFRVSRNQIVFGANYFWAEFPSSRCYIVWDKRGNLPKVPFCDTELAWTSFVDKMPQKYTVINHGFIRDSKDAPSGHPTQKPTELFRMILEDFTKPGDTVFDPFAGSGTTAVACIKTGRHFIGCEIDENYYNVATKRIAEAQLQMPLPLLEDS